MDPLIGQGQFAGALLAEQYPGPQRRHRQHCRPVQHMRECAGVFGIANRLRGNGIHRHRTRSVSHSAR